MRSLAWSLIALSLLGCSKKESPETPQPEPSATPAPEPSAGTAVTTQSAAPAESAAPGDPDADFVALTGPKGQHFVVGRAVVVCGGDCKFPADPPPPMWVIEDGKVREAPELWPANAWTTYAASMKKEKMTSSVSFSGDYPKQLFARGWGEGRTGDGNLPPVKFFVKYWVDGTAMPDFLPSDLPLPPREYDEALLSLPTKQDPRSTFTYGGGGPPVAAEANSLWIRKGKEWVHKVAPWVSPAVLRRLADGDTLALGRGVHRIDKQGEIHELKLSGGSAAAIVDQGGVAYLASSAAVLRPTHPERFKLAPREERTASRSMTVEPKATTGDAGADAGDAGNHPSAAFEKPAAYTDACKTPVIVARTKDGYLPSASDFADLFRKHPDQTLAYPLYKVSFVSGQRYLLRVKDDADARRLLTWVDAEKDLSGELACVDLDALWPDPSVKHERIERVFIHPWSGAQLPLL
ncbi:MAG: hypothetical protein KC766_21230 [Myxococcales bacterium]|nr:hypothetical protein [Myxococcales bacterium]